MTAGFCTNIIVVLFLRKRIVFPVSSPCLLPLPPLLSLYNFDLPVFSPTLSWSKWLICFSYGAMLLQFPVPKHTPKGTGLEFIVFHHHIPISYHCVYFMWLLCSWHLLYVTTNLEPGPRKQEPRLIWDKERKMGVGGIGKGKGIVPWIIQRELPVSL